MNISSIKVLVIDDSIIKSMDISKALNYAGINDVIRVRNQEAGFEVIYESIRNNEPLGLIVTDMHYPLGYGMKADTEAGFKLIERLKREEINIPIVICSTRNFKVPDILGCVWYNELNDLNEAFERIIESF